VAGDDVRGTPPPNVSQSQWAKICATATNRPSLEVAYSSTWAARARGAAGLTEKGKRRLYRATRREGLAHKTELRRKEIIRKSKTANLGTKSLRRIMYAAKVTKPLLKPTLKVAGRVAGSIGVGVLAYDIYSRAVAGKLGTSDYKATKIRSNK